ncbi:MAG: hypothetical protein Q9157_003305 [Trypethelium eluteriae]
MDTPVPKAVTGRLRVGRTGTGVEMLREGREPATLVGTLGNAPDGTGMPVSTPVGRGGATPDGREGTPDGTESTPIGSDGTPVGRGGTPVGRGGTPVGRGGTPAGKDGTPVGKGGMPAGKDGTPAESAGSPAGREGKPDGTEGTPAGKECATAGIEGTAAGKESAPKGTGGTPAGREGAAAGKEGNAVATPGRAAVGKGPAKPGSETAPVGNAAGALTLVTSGPVIAPSCGDRGLSVEKCAVSALALVTERRLEAGNGTVGTLEPPASCTGGAKGAGILGSPGRAGVGRAEIAGMLAAEVAPEITFPA